MQNLLEILLDPNNREPIRLGDEYGHDILFEQVAVLPHGGKIYCLLRPLTPMEGVPEDEAVIFYVQTSLEEEPFLTVETDEAVAAEVYEEYCATLRAYQREKGKRE